MGRLSGGYEARGPFADMAIGEVREYASDKAGRVVLTRTDRPFVHDLCDAYNAKRSDRMLDMGLHWYVDSGGGLQLGNTPERHAFLKRQVDERLGYYARRAA